MDNNNTNEPLLTGTPFTDGTNDISPIKNFNDFFREFYIESKKLWYLAAPAIFTSVFQYSLGAITQVFAGQVGTLALAAFAVENSVISLFSYGFLLGMGSALQTLCGQAYGAGQLNMLGIYMQRSWILLIATTLLLSIVYILSWPILKLIGQSAEISKAAGLLAVWMIPQLFAYAIYFPISRFLQAQSKMTFMAVVSAVILVVHIIFSWLFMLKLGWGLVGAAVVLNLSWWLMVVANLVYILSGYCGEAWSGFSLQAFQNVWAFVRLSMASAVMLCLEMWYYMCLILFAGYLKNAEVSVDALSICMNISGWVVMICFGMNAAVSVRVSNELGAANPRTAKFTSVVAVTSSFLIGLILAALLLIFQDDYPALFSSDTEVDALVAELTPLLAFCIIINNIQPVLTGVAIGAGWQSSVAYVNIACYYIFGMPLGLVMGYTFGLGVKGIWCGMLLGTMLQTLVLLIMVYKTNWNKEASVTEERIRKWGGHNNRTERPGIEE